LSVIETWWWLVFWAAVGLCVGSFLNVVIYRLPLGLSIRDPSWSFCPHCRASIRWYDNLPLVSFLRLGGTARCCGGPISLRYPLIEVTTAVVVLLLLDVFFIAQARSGLNDQALGLSWRLADDWPVFLAHVVLFACLLGMSAIDLEHYWIDTGFSTTAVAAGFVLHALWTPHYSRLFSGGAGWPRPWDSTAAACCAAFVGILAVGVALRLRPEPDSPGETCDAGNATGTPPTMPSPALIHKWWWAWGLLAGLIGLLVAMAAANGRSAPGGLPIARYGVPLLALYVLILAGGAVKRASDTQIVEAIESERPQARKMALRELGCLLPAILLAAATLWAYSRSAAARDCMTSVLHWMPSGFGNWQPVVGLATAATGYVIGAGVGWCVRILGTLAFGREAFGDGDIHMMGAAGCVAGWPIVVLGFVLTCGLALAGWALLLPFKRTRAIPLVPWLSLSFLATVLYYEPLLEFQPVRNAIELTRMLLPHNS
jgi:prepilin signal peptidase PulO-like enzyme (type II secretory pathway)